MYSFHIKYNADCFEKPHIIKLHRSQNPITNTSGSRSELQVRSAQRGGRRNYRMDYQKTMFKNNAPSIAINIYALMCFHGDGNGDWSYKVANLNWLTDGKMLQRQLRGRPAMFAQQFHLLKLSDVCRSPANPTPHRRGLRVGSGFICAVWGQIDLRLGSLCKLAPGQRSDPW